MKSVLFLLITTGLSCEAFAQSSTKLSATTLESTTKANNLLGNKKFEEDKEITDSRLKADSGSLSQYSMKFALSYFGPPVGDLGNKNQPNPDGSLGVYTTSLGGSISGRYRVDSKTAVSLGTGIGVLAPFHGVERTDIKTPFVSYDKNARLGDVQIRNSYGTSITTVPNFRNVGQVGSLSYDNSMIYSLGSSGFAIGLDSSLSAFVYEREYLKKDGKAARYVVGLYPQVKYNFSDKTNLYTSLAANYWNPRSRANESDLLNKTVSGRLGMGIAINRDVYFAPYLNFFPEKMRADTTTISFSTVFSVL